jgi:glycosyltransferase involved in cell wall biosynthesis
MLSVIIPTFDRAAFLPEAIDSVLGQDLWLEAGSRLFKPFELIVVDDGSRDDTRRLVESYGPPVAYHFQPHRGVSAARNTGLALARGEFIAFLDSDDLWLKDKARRQAAYFEAFPETRALTAEEIWVRRGRRVNPGRRHRKYSGRVFDKYLPLCLLSLSASVFRREVFDEVGTFDESLPACEDYDFGLRLAHRFPVILIDRPLIIKRGGHPDQLSRRYWGLDRFRVAALEKALRLDLSPEEEALVRQEIAAKCRVLVAGFEKRGQTAEAAAYRRLAVPAPEEA